MLEVVIKCTFSQVTVSIYSIRLLCVYIWFEIETPEQTRSEEVKFIITRSVDCINNSD